MKRKKDRRTRQTPSSLTSSMWENTWHVTLLLLPTTTAKSNIFNTFYGRVKGRGIFNRMCVSDFILILFEVKKQLWRKKKKTLKILLRILTQLLERRTRFYEWILYLVSARIFHLSYVSFIQWVLRLLMHFTTCNAFGFQLRVKKKKVSKNILHKDLKWDDRNRKIEK